MRFLRIVGVLAAAGMFVAVLMSTAEAGEETVVPVPAGPSIVADPHALSDMFVEIAGLTGPSVVTINSRTTMTAMIPSFPSPFMWDPWGGMQAPMEQEYVMEGVGSGVLVSEDGLILTNHHVVGDADEVEIVLRNGETYPGELVGTDPRTDLAVIRIEASGLPAIMVGDSNELRVGQWVLAVGSPFALSQTVTQGIVSYIGRSGMGLTDYENYIQTDAAINPGNSGGALVDLDGRLVGINTALASRNGGYQGVGFAIPVNTAVDVLQDLVEFGYVRRGWLGVSVQELTPGLADHFGLDPASDRGVLVSQVLDGTPAREYGVERGDVLLSIGGERFESVADFRNLIASYDPGTEVEVGIFRDGRSVSLSVPLGEQEPEIARAVRTEGAPGPGWMLAELDGNYRRQLGPPGDFDGMVVLEVRPAGRAADAGLRVGDIVLQIDGRTVTDPSAADEIVFGADEVLLLVWRGGNTIYMVI